MTGITAVTVHWGTDDQMMFIPLAEVAARGGWSLAETERRLEDHAVRCLTLDGTHQMTGRFVRAYDLDKLFVPDDEYDG